MKNNHTSWHTESMQDQSPKDVPLLARMYRTLGRVESANERSISVVFPAWSNSEIVYLRSQFEDPLKTLLMTDSHFFMKVNLHADTLEEFSPDFSTGEIAEEYTDIDGLG